MLIDIVLPNVPAACAGSPVGRTRDADTDRQRSPKPGRVRRLQADGSSRPSNGELYVSAESVAVCMIQCRQGHVTCYSLTAACSVSERPIVPKSDRQSICVKLRQDAWMLQALCTATGASARKIVGKRTAESSLLSRVLLRSAKAMRGRGEALPIIHSWDPHAWHPAANLITSPSWSHACDMACIRR